jgi:hypothetical protein
MGRAMLVYTIDPSIVEAEPVDAPKAICAKKKRAALRRPRGLSRSGMPAVQ